MVTEERLLSEAEHEALMDGARAAGGDGSGHIFGHTVRNEGQEPIVRDYDFRRPLKFTRENLRLLSSLHDALGAGFGVDLSGVLRSPVDSTLAELHQQAYAEFVDGVNEGYFVYALESEPLPSHFMIAISRDVMFASLDRLQGGLPKRLRADREATDIENGLIQKHLLPLVMEGVRSGWTEVDRLNPKVVMSDTSATYMRIALPSDACLTADYRVHVGDAEGMIRVCYPFAMIESLVAKLADANVPPSSIVRRSPDDDEKVRRGLGNIQVPIIVELGNADVTLNDVLELQVGDVIPLGARVAGDISVLVNGERKYHARPGLRSKRLAIRITSIISESDDQEGGSSEG